MDEQKKVFSERLKKVIADKEVKIGKSLTQKMIADDLHCSRKTINEYLNCRALPDKEMQKLLSSYFRVDIEWLLGETDYKSSIDKWIKNNPDSIEETKVYTALFNAIEKFIVYKNGSFDADVYVTDFNNQIEKQIESKYTSALKKLSQMSEEEKEAIINELLSE